MKQRTAPVTVVYAQNTNADVPPSAAAFNGAWSSAQQPLIVRTCLSCKESHRNIVYKRLPAAEGEQSGATWEPYSDFVETWSDANNVLNVDFELCVTCMLGLPTQPCNVVAPLTACPADGAPAATPAGTRPCLMPWLASTSGATATTTTTASRSPVIADRTARLATSGLR